MTHGKIKAIPHRVRNVYHHDKIRYSAILFAEPKDDQITLSATGSANISVGDLKAKYRQVWKMREGTLRE